VHRRLGSVGLVLAAVMIEQRVLSPQFGQLCLEA
jgi:hypothetical protein